MKTSLPFTLTYESAVAALSHMQLRGWRLGLDRMQAFCESLGVPKGGHAKFLHVAGTNGKGSTTATIQSILVEQGFRTGAYFSPYVYDLRERVQLGRDYISKGDFARLMGPIVEASDEFLDNRFGGPTEFEAKTALGFLYWQEQNCDAVALEVGLGGRLDATNIVDSSVSVITSISLDHTHILGNTLAEIAFEKAGIIKPGRPVIVGALHPEALETIRSVAKERQSPAWVFGEEIQIEEDCISTPSRTYRGIVPALLGSKQLHNSALAIAAVEAAGFARSQEQMVEGVRKATLPGRFEVHQHGEQVIVLDGAHNLEAATVLLESLLKTYPGRKWDVVTGMLEGHDPAGFYAALATVVNRIHVVPVTEPRSRKPFELASLLRSIGFEATHYDSVADGMRILSSSDSVLVTGSFFLLGDAKASLVPARV